MVVPNEVVITPHEGQARVLYSQKRIIIAIAGIQGGKTFCGCIWIQLEIQKKPNGIFLVCSISKDQLDQVVITKFFDLFPGYKKYYNKKEHTVYLPTGGKIFFRSLEEPKYVEGISADAAWIDEGDLITYKAYVIVRGRVGATGGKILITTSIADNSWIVDYSERMNPQLVEIVSWESRDNPAFSQEEWDSLEMEMDPALFARRYKANKNFASGKVYSKFDQIKNVPDAVPSNEIVKRTFIGLDWGYVDNQAIIVIQLMESGRIYIVEEAAAEGYEIEDVKAVVARFRVTYPKALFYADPSNKQMLKSLEAAIHTTITPGVRDIYYGTSIIRNLIWQNRFFVLSRCKEVLRELKHYRFKETVAGRSEEPEDKNNHTLDAIRYVLATYPIPRVTYKKRDEEELPDFWKRRTGLYQRELRRQQVKVQMNNLIT